MKPTSGAVSKNSSGNSINSKSKKTTKDREKRKSSSVSEKTDTNSDKGSPNKDGSSRKYAGIGPESVMIYCEQAGGQSDVSDEVHAGLAEDLSYKLRYVIHDALIKARLCGRNHILSTDLDLTFENLNIDKVLGAPSSPNWIGFGDQNLYYLDDPVVNLVEIAEQPCSYTQPGNVGVTKKWLPDTKDTEPMKNYFEAMCTAVVSNNAEIRQFALNDIKRNTFIGPIVQWFYRFGSFLLSKDITYDCLTLSALSLIKSLEQNPMAVLSVSEKQLKLLVRLLLQRLLRTINTEDVLKSMCSVLALLCERLPLREFVTAKLNSQFHPNRKYELFFRHVELNQKVPEINEACLFPIICIVNALGIDVILEVFLPYMEYILFTSQHMYDPGLATALLQTYSILTRNCTDTETVDRAFYEVFGDSICPLWEPTLYIGPEKVETNWLQIKINLFQTRRKIYFDTRQPGHLLADVFPDYVDLDEQDSSKVDLIIGPGIRFQIKRPNARKLLLPAISDSELRNSLSIYSADDYNPDISFLSELINPQPTYVLIGKRSLLLPSMQKNKKWLNNNNRCCDHSLTYYNL